MAFLQWSWKLDRRSTPPLAPRHEGFTFRTNEVVEVSLDVGHECARDGDCTDSGRRLRCLVYDGAVRKLRGGSPDDDCAAVDVDVSADEGGQLAEPAAREAAEEDQEPPPTTR